MRDESPRVVLYIDSLKLGGAERITLTWADWLHQAGWKPIVLTRKPVSWDFYPLPAGVERVVEPADTAWMHRMGRFAFFFRLLRLQRWLDVQNVDLVVGVTSLPVIKLLFAARLLGVPCVVSERNFPPLKRIGRIWSGFRRLCYPWAALHLVQTRAVGEWMAAHLGVHRQLLLPNPVQWPLARFHPSLQPDDWLSSEGCGSTDPVLLAVGTKADQKGFDRLVRWWIPLAQADASLQLVIVGLMNVRITGTISRWTYARCWWISLSFRRGCISQDGSATSRIGTPVRSSLCCRLVMKVSPMFCWRRWPLGAVVWRLIAPRDLPI